MGEQAVWSEGELLAVTDGAWIATASVRDRVRPALRMTEVASFSDIAADVHSVVVVGGGTLIDAAKLWRHRQRPDVRLIAVASMWGSGAEASPIAIENGGTAKTIVVDAALVPDVRVRWPSLGASVSPENARAACGDTIVHALEALLSPLANPAVRRACADLLRSALALPLAYDAEWFELSAQACALQAQASVGLVHGIAHELEPRLHSAASPVPIGGSAHASLCATYALPVFSFNLQQSAKAQHLLDEFAVDADHLTRVLGVLHSSDVYRALLPLLEAHWMDVVRNACSRTNIALVRPSALEYFRSWTPPA
jgi:alcohol dehydrogenase class IV